MQPALPTPETLLRAGVLLALALSLGVVWWVTRSDGPWTDLRSRFVLGVPWGTLVSMLGVLAVYLFVQGGWEHWRRPVTIPFSSWSYLYPLGWLSAPFSHAGTGHLIGNLVGTLAFAPIAEYFFGHFPRERGSTSFSSWRTNPLARAFVCFPLGVAGIGVLTSVFSWGPIIGFSGVVFAFVGFALVRYPLAAVVALTARSVIDVVYRALQQPIDPATAGPSFSTPWWAGIAVQGHALGLLLGVLLGVLVLYRREERPGAGRLWVGSLLVGVSLSLWAVYWFRGGDSYVLFRAVGVMFVFLVATGITLAARATDRPLVRRRTGWHTLAIALVVAPVIVLVAVVGVRTAVEPGAWPLADWQRDAAAFAVAIVVAGALSWLLGTAAESLTRRQAALLGLCLPLAVMAGIAVPTNLTTVDDAGAPGGNPAVSVRDYTVTYAEDVPNQMVSAVDVEAFGETTKVNTSGVIVVSEQRRIWVPDISKSRLAFAGRGAVRLGGLGWRETVQVRRDGWTAAGGGTAYQVWLRQSGGDWKRAYASDAATADPVLAGNNVSIVPTEGNFSIRLTRDNATVGTTPLPVANETATAGNVTFTRTGNRVVAAVDGTRVTVARKETHGR